MKHEEPSCIGVFLQMGDSSWCNLCCTFCCVCRFWGASNDKGRESRAVALCNCRAIGYCIQNNTTIRERRSMPPAAAAMFLFFAFSPSACSGRISECSVLLISCSDFYALDFAPCHIRDIYDGATACEELFFGCAALAH